MRVWSRKVRLLVLLRGCQPAMRFLTFDVGMQGTKEGSGEWGGVRGCLDRRSLPECQLGPKPSAEC
eukprot:3364374-Rhodomonas_salina.2